MTETIPEGKQHITETAAKMKPRMTSVVMPPVLLGGTWEG
jgi:hypothetical protein